MTFKFNNPAVRQVFSKGEDENLLLDEYGNYIVETWNGRPVFELVEDLIFSVRIGRGLMEVVVPAGFQTDFASIPRPFWLFLPPSGAYNLAGIIHDFLYSKGVDGINEDGEEEEGECSRFLADVLFREAMKTLGVPLWKRVMMYYALRAFGWIAWRTR